eukprot:m51a1_g8802 hypothetical protein (891) ;mRNA; r:259642-263537
MRTTVSSVVALAALLAALAVAPGANAATSPAGFVWPCGNGHVEDTWPKSISRTMLQFADLSTYRFAQNFKFGPHVNHTIKTICVLAWARADTTVDVSLYDSSTTGATRLAHATFAVPQNLHNAEPIWHVFDLSTADFKVPTSTANVVVGSSDGGFALFTYMGSSPHYGSWGWNTTAFQMASSSISNLFYRFVYAEETCVPANKTSLCIAGYSDCGLVDDGCGGTVDCGGCAANYDCVAKHSIPPRSYQTCCAVFKFTSPGGLIKFWAKTNMTTPVLNVHGASSIALCNYMGSGGLENGGRAVTVMTAASNVYYVAAGILTTASGYAALLDYSIARTCGNGVVDRDSYTLQTDEACDSGWGCSASCACTSDPNAVACATAAPSCCFNCANANPCMQCSAAQGCTRCPVAWGLVAASRTCVQCAADEWSSGTAPCAKCPAHCAACDNSTGVCSRCAIGYALLSNNTCSLCPDNWYADGYAPQCQACSLPTGCTNCSRQTGACSACSGDLSLFHGGCELCPGCEATSCTASGGSKTCTRCRPGLGLSGTSCHDCTSTQYSDGTADCQECSATCATCNHTSGNCLTCAPGSGLSGKTCTACPAGTSYSDGTTSCKNVVPNENCVSYENVNGHCLECRPGSGLADGTCQPCTGNTYSAGGTAACSDCAAGCSVCNHTVGCALCSAGFEMVAANRTCSPCTAPNTWSSGDQCKPCELRNCTHCNAQNGLCAACAAGFGNVAGICSPCTGNTWSSDTTAPCGPGPAHCLACTPDGGLCTKCSPSYGLSAGACPACTPNAQWSDGTAACAQVTQRANCSEYRTYEDTCARCLLGFELAANTCTHCAAKKYSNGTLCHDCALPSSCDQCDPTSGVCSHCTGNLTLHGWQCTEGALSLPP